MALKRIAYVLNVFPKFSETFIANEVAELRRRGVELILLSRRNPVEDLRHKVVTENRLEALAHYDQDDFLPLLREFRPQLIHAHFATQPTELARELAARLEIPYCLTAHGYDVYRRPPGDFAERCRDAGAVVTVSSANARYMIDQLGASPANLSVVPCGVDTAWFEPGEGVRAEVPLLLCVARLRPVKNLSILLQACALLRERGLAFRCVIVGDGEERASLEAERARLGLESGVEFAGLASQEAVRDYWRQASVGLLTSLSEGMPVSLMEALSCGVPVVAPAIGGIPEMIRHGSNGFVVPVGDAPAVADAVAKILGDPVLESAMRRAARESARRRFSIEVQVDRLLEIWDRVLHRQQAA